MRIPQSVFRDMVDHARRAWPTECCGILAGKDDVVTRIYPLENRDKSRTSYHAAPEQQLEAFTDMEDLGLDLLAVYHSHPDTESYPSPVDIEKAYFTEALYIIISLKAQNLQARAFRVNRSKMISEEEFEVS